MANLKRGYPTPDTPSEITMTTRCVTIPDIPEFVALIGGLLYQATQAHFWRSEGTMSVTQATELMADALALYDAESECAMACEDFIDCIENNEATQAALQIFLSESGHGSGAGSPSNPSYWIDNPTWLDGSQITDCDNDNLFGGITQTIEFINLRIVDFFQQVELVTNAVERSASAIAAIPVVGALPIDEMIAFVDQLFNEIAEGYEAAYTETLKDEYRCDLFCLVRDTCELDFATFANYFLGRLGEAFDTGESFQDLIVWFTTGVFSADGLVDAAYGLVCSALAYSSEVFGININGLATSLTAAMNDPDPDWEIICEDCPQISYQLTTDFTSGIGTFIILQGTQNANGIDGADFGDFKASGVYIVFSQNVNLVRWEFVEERIDGIANGSDDSFTLRSNLNTDGVFPIGDSFGGAGALANGIATRCSVLGAPRTMRQMLIQTRVTDNATSDIYLKSATLTIEEPESGFVIQLGIPPC